MLTVNDILISSKKPTISYEHFPHFVIEDFLPREEFESLRRSFPSENVLGAGRDTEYGMKKMMTTRQTRSAENGEKENIFHEFCKDAPEWGFLANTIRSQEFIDDLYSTIRLGLWKTRGISALARWEVEKATSQVSQGVVVEQHFSLLQQGGFLNIHSDSTWKLASIILHFNDDDWSDEWGGGTQFYCAKTPKSGKKWHSFSLNHVPVDRNDEFLQDMRPFINIPCKPNSLIVFLKNDRSYHQVKPVHCPEGKFRKSLITNICANDELSIPFRISQLQQYAKKGFERILPV